MDIDKLLLEDALETYDQEMINKGAPSWVADWGRENIATYNRHELLDLLGYLTLDEYFADNPNDFWLDKLQLAININ